MLSSPSLKTTRPCGGGPVRGAAAQRRPRRRARCCLGPGRVQSPPNAPEVGGEGLQQEHLLAEGHQRRLSPSAGRPGRPERRPSARRASDRRRSGSCRGRARRRQGLLLEHGLSTCGRPGPAARNRSRSGPAGSRPCRDAHLDADDTHLRPEDRRRLGAGEASSAQRGGAHWTRPLPERSRPAWPRPAGRRVEPPRICASDRGGADAARLAATSGRAATGPEDSRRLGEAESGGLAVGPGLQGPAVEAGRGVERARVAARRPRKRRAR